MDVSTNINRIRNIMYNDYEIVKHGDINSIYGMSVKILDKNGNHIGESCIIDYENGLNLSPNLSNFMKRSDNTFNQNNSVYQYNLSINKPYQGLGWSKKLKNECHEIIKDYGFNYIMSIIKRDNFKSKNLLMGLGYKKHLSNEDRYLLYFKL